MRADRISWGKFFAPDIADRWAGLVYKGADPQSIARNICGGAPVYLATPEDAVADKFGNWTAQEMAKSAGAISRRALHLYGAGVVALSPLVIADHMRASSGRLSSYHPDPPDPRDAKAWEAFCRPILSGCCAVVVPDLPFWPRSPVVFNVVLLTISRNLPVFFDAHQFGGDDAL